MTRVFQNMRLTTKAIAPVIAVSVAFAVLLIWGFYSSTRTAASFNSMITRDDAAVVKLARFSRATAMIPYAVYRLNAYACTKGEMKACDQAVADINEAVISATANIDDAIRIDPDQETHLAAMSAFKSRFDDLVKEMRPVAELGLKDDPAGGGALKLLDPKFLQLSAEVLAFNDKGLAENAAQARDISEGARVTSLQMLVVGLSTVILGLSFAVWLSISQVSRPLVRLGGAMRDIAEGDLDVEIAGQTRADEVGGMSKAVQIFKENAIQALALQKEADLARSQAEAERRENERIRAEATEQQVLVVDSVAFGLERLSSGDLVYQLVTEFAPEYEKLRDDFNTAMSKLQETLRIVSANTTAIRSGTEEIATAADDLSKRTEQQAASLEETAAALDEITNTVRETASGANHARDVVGAAKSDAERSGHVVRRAVEAMNGIERSSGQIGQIIGVIDEIAFQTNLLALNAGVEAARAGEAGRGFAVVASEVRALAQRSAEAAKEIKTLISASAAQVEQGVDLVAETGQALDRIVGQINELSGVVGQIAASAQQQAAGLDQINTAVTQMDQVTQQNSAMVEQSTAASRSLAQETEELARLIGRFQLGQGGAGSVQRPASVRSSAQPARSSAVALKTTGRGGPARRPEAGPALEASWQEF